MYCNNRLSCVQAIDHFSGGSLAAVIACINNEGHGYSWDLDRVEVWASLVERQNRDLLCRSAWLEVHVFLKRCLRTESQPVLVIIANRSCSEAVLRYSYHLNRGKT